MCTPPKKPKLPSRAVDADILVTTVQQLAARCSVPNTAIAGTWYYYLLQVAVGSSGK